MIGIFEIIFAVFMFCLMWFFIFKFKLMWDNKKKLKGIAEKIEKQDKKFFIDGKETDLKKELGIIDNTKEEKEVKKE